MSAVPVLTALNKAFGLDNLKTDSTCSTCTFSDFSEDHRICRRFPPNANGHSSYGWPIVDSLDWCGEYLPVAANH